MSRPTVRPAAHRAIAALALLLLGGTTAPVGPAAPPLRTRWILMYGGDRRPIHYSVDDCLRLVAGVDSAGRPTRWLSTGAILLARFPKGGRTFTSWTPAGAVPAIGQDWQDYLDSMVTPNGPLARLDSAVQETEAALGPLSGGYDVAIMTPYPDPRGDSLRFQGNLYDFHTPDGRAGAVRAFVTELARRFPSGGYGRLRLRGIYWLYENAPPRDTLTLQAASRAVHDAGLRFFWIPSYHAEGVPGWRRWGFDEAWFQPNYFFHPEVGAARMDTAYATARAAGMGLEIEMDKRLMGDTLFRPRLEPYLQMVLQHSEVQAGSLAIYEGAGALIALSRSTAPEDRRSYQRFLQVIAAGN